MSDLPMKFNPAFLDEETLVRTFVIRAEEFGEVLSIVRANTGEVNQHVLLVGIRGVGKTTLALRLAAEVRRDPTLQELWYPVVFSEESYGILSAGEFWQEALFHIGEQTGERKWQEARDELDSEPDEERLRERALERLMEFSDDQKKRLLLIVENLDMLIGDQMDNDEDAQALLSVLQTEARVMLLGTTTQSFEAISKGGTLERLFHVVPLKALDTLEDVGALWTLSNQDAEPQIPMRPIEILTGGNPRLIRILAEFAAHTSFRELMNSLVRLVDDHTEYFKQQIDALPARERKVFVALADRWDRSSAREIVDATRLGVSQVSASLNRLEKRGMVTLHRQAGRSKLYDVTERLFNIYHLMRRRRQASARVKATVRFMIQMYEGDKLLTPIRALADEACSLDEVQRRDHYVAFSEVLDLAEPELRHQILDETREKFLSLPDLPAPLLERFTEDNRYDTWSDDSILAIDPKSFSEVEVRQYVLELSHREDRISGESFSLALLRGYDRILELNLGLASVHVERGRVLLELGRPKEALIAIDRGLELDAISETAHVLRGNILQALDRFEEAVDAFDAALELNPKLIPAYSGRAFTLGMAGQAAEAVIAFNDLLELEPDNAGSHLGRALSLKILGQLEEALGAVDKSIGLNPDIGFTHSRRGKILQGLGRTGEALAAFDQALEIDPNDPRRYADRGGLLGPLGRSEEALDAFDRSLELEADDVYANLGRGLALFDLGRLDEALAAFDRSVELDPDHAFAHGVRGRALGKLGRSEEALTAFDRSLELDHNIAPVRIARAKSLALLGRTEEALSVFSSELRRSDMGSRVSPILDLAMSLAALQHTESTLRILEDSQGAEQMEPLVVALRMDLGEEIDVALEIEEVAKDILSQIIEKRTVRQL